MSDQTDNSQGQQPTHEAARVVIPFDLDMTIVDRKIEELERRVKALIENKSQQGSPVQLQQAPAPAGQPIDQERQLVIIAIQNISLMVREIRDAVQLIQANMIDNG